MKFIKLYLLLVLITKPFIADAALGSFQQIAGSPFTAGNGPAWVAYSPIVMGNLFAAIPNYYGNSVSVYLANQSTGALTEIIAYGSPFASGSNPAAIAYSPLYEGNLFAAIVNQNDDTISTYTITQSTGQFWEILPRTATGVSPSSVAYSPVLPGNKLFAAVTNSDHTANSVSIYSVNLPHGAFTEILIGSPLSTGSKPQTVAFSQVISGVLYAAITNLGDNTVSFYTVNQSSGEFSQIGSPLPTGINPYGVAFSPEVQGNLFAAVCNDNTNEFVLTSSISVYKLQAGSFVEIPGSAFEAGIQPNEIAFSPYTTDELPSITVSADQFALCPNVFAICPGSPIQLTVAVTGAPPYNVHWSDGFTQIIQGNLFAAAVNFVSNNVSVYSVDQITGFFTQVAGSPFSTGPNSQPDGIAFSPILEKGNLFAGTANFGSNNTAIFQVTNFSQATRLVSPTSTTQYSAIVTDANSNSATSNTITIRVANNCNFCS